jgi:hypothetical protein
MDVNWVKDDAAIAVLNEIGIDVFDAEISVSTIDKKASKENRAREIPLDDERIEGFQSSMIRGVPIPKIVVRKTLRGMVIAGGNHRFASVNGTKTLPVHVIECTDEEFEVACGLLNTYVGVGMSKNERIKKSVMCVSRLGFSAEEAAKRWGVSVCAVRDACRMRDVSLRFPLLPAKIKDRVTASHIKSLGDLTKNDNVLKAAFACICDSKATAKEIADIAKHVRQQPTEAAQIAVFEEHARKARKEAVKVIPRKTRKVFLQACTTIQNMKDKQTWQSLQFQHDEIENGKKIVLQLMDMFSCLLKANG